MSGQMGNVRVTTQNLEIVEVDVERNLIMVKGVQCPDLQAAMFVYGQQLRSVAKALLLAERANEFRFSSKRRQRGIG